LKAIRLLVLLLLLPLPTCFGQHPSSTAPRTANPNPSLAKPVTWNLANYRLFKNDEASLSVFLATSWISSEKHEGMFRYKLSIFPAAGTIAERQKHPEWSDPEWKEKFMQRVVGCSFFAELYDVDQFRLRTIPIYLQKGVDEQARLSSLNVNSSEQMGATEYRSLIGTDTTSGSWGLSWSCPSNQ
jgi:hypothetical protein